MGKISQYASVGFFFIMIVTSVFAKEEKEENVKCPKAEQVVVRGKITEEEKDHPEETDNTIVYCAPSKEHCQWKGFDAYTTDKSTVDETKLIEKYANYSEKYGTYSCDFVLKNGNYLRMSIPLNRLQSINRNK